MSNSLFESLSEFISDARLKPYREAVESDDEFLICALYFWNTALCESFYPALQALEVGLRNSLYSAIRNHTGIDYWFKSILTESHSEEISRIQRRLEGRSGQPVNLTADLVVGNSEFGFWTRFFSKEYANPRQSNHLPPAVLISAFPHQLGRSSFGLATINRRLSPIQRFRNRVFHHEPIWHLDNLEQVHFWLMDTIRWLNPDMVDVLRLVDRFPEVHSHGPGHYRDILSDKLFRISSSFANVRL